MAALRCHIFVSYFHTLTIALFVGWSVRFLHCFEVHPLSTLHLNHLLGSTPFECPKGLKDEVKKPLDFYCKISYAIHNFAPLGIHHPKINSRQHCSSPAYKESGARYKKVNITRSLASCRETVLFKTATTEILLSKFPEQILVFFFSLPFQMTQKLLLRMGAVLQIQIQAKIQMT